MLITRCDSPAGIDFTVSVFVCHNGKNMSLESQIAAGTTPEAVSVTVIAKQLCKMQS